MDSEVSSLVEALQLLPHPEGGFYRETYRSSGVIKQQDLSEAFAGDRSYCTGIYYLLPAGACSHLHRIGSDEMWHFYQGNTLTVHVFDPEKGYYSIKLGPALHHGEVYQAVVPAGAWFGATVEEGYALVGCTVAPGFDFAEFELAEAGVLVKDYPMHQELILSLTLPET